MGFADWGSTPEEGERRRQEQEEERERIQREGAEAVGEIYDEVRRSSNAHAEYREWMQRTGRTDVPFEDWRAGRYVHVVIRTEP